MIAGSGAQSYQLSAREVSFANGAPANPPAAPQPVQVTVHVSLDGKPFDQKIVTANSQLLNALTNSLSQQRSG